MLSTLREVSHVVDQGCMIRVIRARDGRQSTDSGSSCRSLFDGLREVRAVPYSTIVRSGYDTKVKSVLMQKSTSPM